MSNTAVANLQSGSNDALKDFQLSPESISSKSDPAWGLLLAKKINGTIGGGLDTYYAVRNSRFRKNRDIAAGRLDVQAMFQDYLGLNGKANYANLNWSCIKLGNRIISGLVGRFVGRGEKCIVTATDSLSLNEKKEEYENLEFIIENKARLQQLEQQSGIPLIPQDDRLPADQEELNLWVTQIQKLPEEICYEMGCNDVLESNGFFGTIKEMLYHDSTETGFVGTYTWMDSSGVIHVERVKPENAVYSYSEYDDFRDTTFRGQVRSMKISELRKKYGAEFGGKLTERQLFEIAATAKEYQQNDKITWLDDWSLSFARPYDEWNIDVLDFELKTVDSEAYTIVTTNKNKSTIIKKGRPKKKADNEEVVEDTKWNIYRGVFARNNDLMLEWGLKKNMIRPHDPKEIGNAEFSYSFFLYQNREMRNVAVPEKIEEPLEQMILARLKMQQLVAKMKPIGAAVNVDALQELDLGLGGITTPGEVKRIYEQTGDLYYRGRDAEGNPIPVPIQELANAGFLNQMQGLINLYSFHYQVLKDELGEDPNLITSAVQPRVTSDNVQVSQQQSENATDYMYRAVSNVLADTSNKISCLLKDSVKYGSSAYRALIKEEDVTERQFATKIQMLPTEYEIQKFEVMMAEALRSNPELIMFVDPFQLSRLAKENVKLAETLFRKGQKNMLKNQMQQAQQNAELNAKAQQESLKMKADMDKEMKETEGKVEILKAQMTGEAANKTALLTGFMKMFQTQQETGQSIPREIAPLGHAIFQSVGLATAIQDEEKRNMVMQQMQQAQMEQEQAAQEEQAAQQQAQQQQPQLQVA